MEKEERETLETFISNSEISIKNISDKREESIKEILFIQDRVADYDNSLSKLNNNVEYVKERLAKYLNYVLMLEIDIMGRLNVLYKKDEKIFPLGFISNCGELSILSDSCVVANYNEWREHGMKTDRHVMVEWGEKESRSYFFDNQFLSSAKDGKIEHLFNFNSCGTLHGSTDKNIQRFPHNNRPIMF